jgi:integrase
MIGKISATRLRTLKDPGRYGDGGGLWLQVRAGRDGAAPNRSWLFRFTTPDGKGHWMGLGAAEDVMLAEAREKARECRRIILDGRNPLTDRKHARQEAVGVSFRDVAAQYIAAHEPTWKNPVHRKQWTSTLDAYVFPVLGDVGVRNVDTEHVMKVLEPIWHAKPETATRVRGRIEVVLDYAAARRWRTGENPARWRGHLAKLLPAPTTVKNTARAKTKKSAHHAAEPWASVGVFMAALRNQKGASALALEFTILTAARTGEVIGAKWDEVDVAARSWTIPVHRMKAGVEHRVALSEAALAVLAKLKPLGGEYVFPGGKANAPLSNMAMLALLARMGRPDLTVHGFRSTFRDWAAEATHHPAELAEAALAHTIKDKVVAAYQRGDLFEKRRKLMADWAAHCAGLTT